MERERNDDAGAAVIGHSIDKCLVARRQFLFTELFSGCRRRFGSWRATYRWNGIWVGPRRVVSPLASFRQYVRITDAWQDNAAVELRIEPTHAIIVSARCYPAQHWAIVRHCQAVAMGLSQSRFRRRTDVS